MSRPRAIAPMIGVAIACLVVLCMQGWIEWQARKTQVRETDAALLNLASSLTQHAEDTIEIADTAVVGVVARLESDGFSPEVFARIEGELAVQVAAGHRFHSISILDVNGRWIAPAALAKGRDFSDRTYFRHHRDQVDHGAFIGPPVQSRVDGEWYLTVSRRLQAPDGSFGGVVTASIKLSYFADYYASYQLGADSSIVLMSTHGILLARSSVHKDFVGQDLSDGLIFRKLREHSSGSYMAKSIIDGVERYYGYRESVRYPLLVAAAMSTREALGAWRIGAREDMAVTLALTGAVGLLGLYLGRQVQRTRRAEQVQECEMRIRLQAERLQEAESRERRAVEATNASLDKLSRHLAKARDRAEQANRAKSRFLAGMSHELRTPLNGLLGYTQLLRIEGGLTAKQGARVDAMLGAGKHLLEMITVVLDLSEIEAERVELLAATFDVRAAASACLDLVRPTAEAKGLALSMTMAPGTWGELKTDSIRFRQVLLNLLGNAVKFTSRGSVELRLRLGADGSMLRIEVADTGAGIPAAQRDRLFQDFERLDTEATRAAEGAGLGLALAARLAGLMGGRIGHEDNPGGGSVFWLELPGTAPAPSAPPAAGDGLEAQKLRALRVLVVDDMLMNREIASSLLQAAGHQAICAESGASAIAAAAGTDFDVILMDVRMPGMSGLEATRRIRSLGGQRGQVPIVALTAQAFTDQVAECRSAGMDSHLAKPFEIDSLFEAIACAVDRRRGAHGSPPTAATAFAAADVPFMAAESPVLDGAAFDRTAACFTPQAMAAHLQTIADLGDSLLRGLREPNGGARNTDALGAAAHALVGSAGMFGFERLAALCRILERTMDAGAAEPPMLAEALDAVIEATRQEIRRRTPKIEPV